MDAAVAVGYHLSLFFVGFPYLETPWILQLLYKRDFTPSFWGNQPIFMKAVRGSRKPTNQPKPANQNRPHKSRKPLQVPPGRTAWCCAWPWTATPAPCSPLGWMVPGWEEEPPGPPVVFHPGVSTTLQTGKNDPCVLGNFGMTLFEGGFLY